MRGMTTPHRIAPFTITTPGESFYAIKECLKAAGWPIVSGDGLAAYDGTTDVITHSGTGAGGANNPLAWIWALQPAAVNGLRKSFCLQLVIAGANMTTNTLRGKFSPNDGFVTGSPSATVTPSAADEVVTHGSGSDASPTGDGFFANAPNVHLGIADASAPHGFAFWSFETSGVDNDSSAGHRFALDPLNAPHHTDVQDPDKYAIHLTGDRSAGRWQTVQMATQVTGASDRPAYGRNHSGAYSFMTMHTYASPGDTSGSPTVPDTSNPYPHASNWTSKVQFMPIVYGTNVSGIKGYSTMFHWQAGDRVLNDNNRCYTVDGEANAYVKFEDLIIPWGTTPPTDFSTEDGEILDIASAAIGGDNEGPVITLLDPPEGLLAVTLAAARDKLITFRIADADGIQDVIITCLFEGDNEPQLVHDDEGFWGRWGPYGAAVETDEDGKVVQIDFGVRPVEGWRRDIVALKVNGYDLIGGKEGVVGGDEN